jgi:phosphopentomutase
LRDGLRQAKEDLDAARKGREKLMKARQTAQEETENLETQVARAEAQASAAQEALTRTRRLDRSPDFFLISPSLSSLILLSDLEESKRREVRLRAKIKEIGENPGSAGDEDPTLLREGISRLQKELEITKSENASLRSSLFPVPLSLRCLISG